MRPLFLSNCSFAAITHSRAFAHAVNLIKNVKEVIVSADVKSLSTKVSKLDWLMGVVGLIAAALLFIYARSEGSSQFSEYAIYCLVGAGISFLAAWIKPGALFTRALERKMIRKRGPRSL